MADASTSVYEFDSVVRGQHFYRSPLTDKAHTVLPQIMAQVFISFQQLFTPATKRDQAFIQDQPLFEAIR